MPGSTFKSCSTCGQQIRVAVRKCHLCGVAQPMKKGLESKKTHYDINWAKKIIDQNNRVKVINSVHLLVHTLEMLGMVPFFLLGHPKQPNNGWVDLVCHSSFQEQQPKTLDTLKKIFELSMKALHKNVNQDEAPSTGDPLDPPSYDVPPSTQPILLEDSTIREVAVGDTDTTPSIVPSVPTTGVDPSCSIDDEPAFIITLVPEWPLDIPSQTQPTLPDDSVLRQTTPAPPIKRKKMKKTTLEISSANIPPTKKMKTNKKFPVPASNPHAECHGEDSVGDHTEAKSKGTICEVAVEDADTTPSNVPSVPTTGVDPSCSIDDTSCMQPTTSMGPMPKPPDKIPKKRKRAKEINYRLLHTGQK